MIRKILNTASTRMAATRLAQKGRTCLGLRLLLGFGAVGAAHAEVTAKQLPAYRRENGL